MGLAAGLYKEGWFSVWYKIPDKMVDVLLAYAETGMGYQMVTLKLGSVVRGAVIVNAEFVVLQDIDNNPIDLGGSLWELKVFDSVENFEKEYGNG